MATERLHSPPLTPRVGIYYLGDLVYPPPPFLNPQPSDFEPLPTNKQLSNPIIFFHLLSLFLSKKECIAPSSLVGNSNRVRRRDRHIK